jgi:hypothetical protein
MSETKKSKKEFQYQSRVIVLGEIDDENVNNKQWILRRINIFVYIIW